MRKGISIAAILFFSCTACKQEEFTIDELVKFSEDDKNGMRKSITLAGVNYVTQYRPAALIISAEGGPDSIDAKRLQLLNEMYWFNIDISIDGFNQSPIRYMLTSLEEYNARLDYFLNNAQRDIWILNNNDTLYPTSYWFENNHNLIPKETIVLGFEKSRLKEDAITLSFNDRVFKTGIVKFGFSKEKLDKKIVLKQR